MNQQLGYVWCNNISTILAFSHIHEGASGTVLGVHISTIPNQGDNHVCNTLLTSVVQGRVSNNVRIRRTTALDKARDGGAEPR